MERSVSFIIPAYCTPRSLLLRCLESVVSIQSDLNFEIIVVDDGTPDDSVKECVLGLGDDRIRYIYQANSGQGQARNAGLEVAIGEYVQFLDSDDFLMPSVYESCLGLLARYEPDLLLFGHNDVYGNTFNPHQQDSKAKVTMTSGVDYILRRSMLGIVWNVIVRRDLLNGLRFTSGIFHEDEEFAPLMLLRSKCMLVTDLKPYAYFHHDKSTIGNIETPNLERKFCDMVRVVVSLRKKCSDFKGKEKLALEKRVAQLCESMLYNVIRLSPDRAFFDSWFLRLKDSGMYPIPKRNYNFNYKLFRFATDADWKVKLCYKILNKR